MREIIGVCPQELALYPELSARDNLVFFGRMAGLSGREASEASNENLERVGLLDRAKDKVDKFSGGMKRRVNIAIALMSRPQLCSWMSRRWGLIRNRAITFSRRWSRCGTRGLTVLYTTHYMEEADRLCDRLGIMDNGRVIRLGSPRELKSEIGDPAEVSLESVFLELTGRNLRD